MSNPSIILIVMDTVRAANLSCYGYARETTPNLDRIAEESMRYEFAFSPSPWTLPAHASIFTGLYPSTHQAHELHRYLDTHLETIQKQLRKQGYRTYGVSANPWISSAFGFEAGFNRFVKIWQLYQTSTDVNQLDRSVRGWSKLAATVGLLAQGNPFSNVLNKAYSLLYHNRYDKGARRINRVVHRWLSAEQSYDGPFYLFINYLEAHLPYGAPNPYRYRFVANSVSTTEADAINQDPWPYIAGLFEMSAGDFEVLQALYDAELLYLDHRIGELYRMLETLGLLEDTILVITSDHGENIGDHGLMDHQYCLYDTLLRVPLFIRYPRQLGRGTVVAEQVQTLDILPTIMELVGTVPTMPHQGTSLLKPSRQHVIAEYMGPQPSVESLTQEYPGMGEAMLKHDRSLKCVRTPTAKLIQASDGWTELYDVAMDPHERDNLRPAQLKGSETLLQELENWGKNGTTTVLPSGSGLDASTRQRLRSLGYLD